MKFFFSFVYSFVFSKLPFERQNKGPIGLSFKIKRFAEKENVGKKTKDILAIADGKNLKLLNL